MLEASPSNRSFLQNWLNDVHNKEKRCTNTNFFDIIEFSKGLLEKSDDAF